MAHEISLNFSNCVCVNVLNKGVLSKTHHEILCFSTELGWSLAPQFMMLVYDVSKG